MEVSDARRLNALKARGDFRLRTLLFYRGKKLRTPAIWTGVCVREFFAYGISCSIGWRSIWSAGYGLDEPAACARARVGGVEVLCPWP
jgi:hypothetical protein